MCSYTAVVPPLADEWLDPTTFQVVGMWPRVSWLSNRRFLDANLATYCAVSGEKIDDANWGLPVPNMQAAYKSLSKYNQAQPLVDMECWALANEFFVNEFYPHMCESRVVSQEEAIATLDKTTSTGFPYNLDYKDKAEWLKDTKNLAQCALDWERMASPEYVFICVNSVKEEIRPRAKIVDNKQRTFTAFPVIASINGSRLCVDMNEKFYAAAMKTSSTVGIDVFHRGWDDVFRRLSRFPLCGEIDVSSMDSVLFHLIFAAILQFRIMCLRDCDRTPENVARLESLYRNTVWALIILADGLIVRKNTGNPSGSINTITDNTMALFLMLSYAWAALAPAHLRNYASFKQSLVLCLTGDDNTWCATNEVWSFFNYESLTRVFASLGVTITTPHAGPRPLQEVTYLSRRFDIFINDPAGVSVCVPVLDREKMLVSLAYSEKPMDPVYSLIRAVGIYQVTWADVEMRKFMRRYITWLVYEFGGVFHDDITWINALKGFKPDNFMLQLYTCRVPGKSLGYKAREKEFHEDA